MYHHGYWQILREEPAHTLQFDKRIQNQKNRGKKQTGIDGMRPGRAEEARGGLVVVPRGELEHQLEVYAWRTRTNQPLLAADCVELQLRAGEPFLPPAVFLARLARSPVPSQAAITLRVQTEPSSALSVLMPLPLSQHLYCLKQAAYGLEQLHCCFGGFDPVANGLRVCAEGRVKVWGWSGLQSNPVGEAAEQAEGRVVGGLIRIFEEWRMESAGFRQFYEGVHIANTFLQLLRYIHAFIERNKIKVDKRLLRRGKESGLRPQSPKPELGRVPKFLSPSALSPKNNAAFRLSLGNGPAARRLPQPLLQEQPSSPSPSPEKAESISLKQTTETRSPRRVNLVRTDKQRKGSDSNFCFTSLHRLQAARDNLLGQAKTSCLNVQAQTMTSLNPGSSLLRNVQQLFEEEQLEGLSVSVELKGRQEKPAKRLANYGRKVNESFINAQPKQ